MLLQSQVPTLQFLGKAEIAAEAQRLGLNAGLSWSCYDPQPGGVACGMCESCLLRKAGFDKAGIKDSIPYAV